MCTPDNDSKAHIAMSNIGQSLNKLVLLNGGSIECQTLKRDIEINVEHLIEVANEKLSLCFETFRAIKELEQNNKLTLEEKFQSLHEVMKRLESNI